jgi:hypothetical protein
MALETMSAIVIALVPFLVLGGLLWISQEIGRRRSARVARQIMLTDAIHRELGAAAAPEVRRQWRGAWTVVMAVPIESDALVAALVRITQQFFSELDQVDVPRLQIVLRPRARRVGRQYGTVSIPRRPAAKLNPAA